jgi:hypothetical protein
MKNAEIDGKKIKMQIVINFLLVVGHRRTRQIQDHHLNLLQVKSFGIPRGAHGIILVYDVTDR